ncbi:MAG: phospholipase A [Deltaproteobacteria bacterium]|nr:phospholipase A [Deltaproteobacteria bacterium]
MKIETLPVAVLFAPDCYNKFKIWGMLRGLMLVAIFLLLAGVTFATDQTLTPTLHFGSLQLTAEQPTLLTVYFHNETGDALQQVLPESLSLRVQAEDGSTTLVTAVEVEASSLLSVAVGEFQKKDYRIVFPASYQGIVEVLLVEHPKTALLLNLSHKQETVESAEDTPEQQPDAEIYPTRDSLFSLYQPYSINLSSYEPMYFLIGTDPGKSKLQLSFKYRLFNPSGSLSHQYNWLRGLYFAYTQTSFWDLSSDSAPFEDTSYKPELFLLSSNWTSRPKWMQGFFIQSGIQHESNGRGVEFSRSTNAFYIKPTMIFFDAASDLGLQLSPKLSAYFNNDDETNPDLADYRGHVELELKFGKADGFVSTTQLRLAKRGASVQTDLSYPISKLLKNNFDLFFQIQYTNARAESLINYRERDHALRLGFAIVR